MKYLSFALFLIITGCATTQAPQSPMLQCKSLCTNNKVEKYKDDTMECRCNVTDDESNE